MYLSLPRRDLPVYLTPRPLQRRGSLFELIYKGLIYRHPLIKQKTNP